MRQNQTAQLCLRVKPEIRDWLMSVADKEERSMNWVVNKILEKEMLNEPEDKDHAK